MIDKILRNLGKGVGLCQVCVVDETTTQIDGYELPELVRDRIVEELHHAGGAMAVFVNDTEAEEFGQTALVFSPESYEDEYTVAHELGHLNGEFNKAIMFYGGGVKFSPDSTVEGVLLEAEADAIAIKALGIDYEEYTLRKYRVFFERGEDEGHDLRLLAKRYVNICRIVSDLLLMDQTGDNIWTIYNREKYKKGGVIEFLN